MLNIIHALPALRLYDPIHYKRVVYGLVRSYENYISTSLLLLSFVFFSFGKNFTARVAAMVGTITLLALTGLLVFLLFFVAATVNAIVISLLMSLAAAGGFLALFFAFVTAIYIGALSIAVFVISTTTITAIIAAVIATGWIGFFWTVWLATKKSMGLAKHSLTMTGSALSAYTSARQAHQHREPVKSD